MNGIAYRTAQFVQALTRRAPSAQMARARTALPGRLLDLFQSMPPREQVHALDVYRFLLDQGHHHPDLLTAALLHDVGRAAPPRAESGPHEGPITRDHLRSLRGLMERVLAVIGFRLLPRAARHWAAGEPRGLRRPFVVSAHHADWGAESVRRAGGSPLLVELIRRHHEQPPAAPADETDRLLRLLRQADGSN